VSPVQLRRDGDVQGLLSLLGSGPAPLVLELTESALMEDSAGVQRFLAQARALGCRVALDDFGTGFSSLSYLRTFEFDVLKIDKTFIDEMTNSRDYGLVASIVSMGRILGMRVVAEGVETAEQVKRLRQIGCDYVQGYYFSRPLPAEAFLRYLQSAAADVRQIG
jgi:EAL domain-containing protein (putative c-di-GMP-specific phosphodiesterase class I)